MKQGQITSKDLPLYLYTRSLTIFSNYRPWLSKQYNFSPNNVFCMVCFL